MNELLAVLIILAPINPQCDDKQFAEANPSQCQVFSPFPSFNVGHGGPGEGGLGGLLHRLTGGLL